MDGVLLPHRAVVLNGALWDTSTPSSSNTIFSTKSYGAFWDTLDQTLILTVVSALKMNAIKFSLS